MKILLTLALTLMMSVSFAKDIKLTGLQAKAVYDSLAIQELEVFQDGGMGKRYINIDYIYCFKSTKVDNELMACVLSSGSLTDMENYKHVNLGSTDNYSEVGNIRFALAEATKNEVVSAERKDLKIKKLSCKYSGYGHVLDSLEIEVKYECNISI